MRKEEKRKDVDARHAFAGWDSSGVPHHVERTRSLLTSEVKRRRAQTVRTGVGDAWEVLRALSPAAATT